ncbi:fructosamine kinase family protein [Nitrosospira sp. Nsp13]|uniref:fructosamine kinase family protein n=1 Tax=Nitrosospira sp. Nsp13 TaxID=1855332 RepID=UPI000889BB73|nr:fructosamine kinase family protein [Nitrosospira sp. Nsp13]SCY45195.1 Fructosamine-3-kinase [Nitrosospira sp. Nsp13]
MLPWSDITAQISNSTGFPFAMEKAASIGGGCINEAHRIEGNGRRFFVKLNHADSLAMFEAEAMGLQEIYRSHTLRVPVPVCWGKNKSKAWLVLEYLEMSNVSSSGTAALGARLAAMHRISSGKFGWMRDNTIGATLQINSYSPSWIQFWREQRLGYQLQLARVNGYTGKLQTQGEQLLAQLDFFFPEAKPVASLLHGDLWSGNYSFDHAGQPVLFDPAVYYGDRETDIAMTELFGGFPAAFYAAYREAYPLDPGYSTRKTLYNLYHILNHLNLFGGGYLRQAEQMTGRLLAEIH